MNPTISIEKLADIRHIAAKLERLPKSTRLYIAGYVEGAADISEQSRSGERREGA